MTSHDLVKRAPRRLYRKRDGIEQTPCLYERYLVEKVINIDQNSRSQTAMKSVSKFSTESVGSRRELVASEFCSHRRRRRDATRQLSRVGVGGVHWALESRYAGSVHCESLVRSRYLVISL